jgi:protein-S-isoprenylcysteine O-methyltransferase Ste14
VMPLPPPVVALAAALAQRALTGATERPGAARTAVAAAVGVASVSMAGVTAGLFRRSETTVDPLHPDRASVLVTTGPNAVSRNPMYVGMAGVLLANAVWRGRWVALLPVAGFVALIDRLQIEEEESALLEKFGDEYQAYRASSPRWISPRSLPLRGH